MDMKFKYISLYCCEKKDRCGNGGYFKRLDYYDEEDFEEKKKVLREEQKMKNDLYRKDHPARPVSKNGWKKQQGLLITKKITPGGNKYKETNELFEIHDGIPELYLDQDTGNSFVILGSSKAGKTTFMVELYKKIFENQPVITTLFSINEHADIYKPLNIIKCNKFNRDCERLINQMKKVNMKNNNKFEYLLLFDDIIDAKYSQLLNGLILTYRNSNFSSLISLQYPYLLSKASRSSINQCFFGRFNTDESIENVCKSFLSSYFTKLGYSTLPGQVALYKELTKDYCFLYYYSREDKLVRFRINLQ